MDKKNYRALLFDLDQTVFDFNAAEEISLRLTFEKFNLPFDHEILQEYRRVNLSIWHDIEKGIYRMDQLRDIRFQTLFQKQISMEEAYRIEDELIDQLSENVILIDDAFEVIRTLHQKRRIYAASNGFLQMQKRRLEKSQLIDFFDGVFVSDDVGFSKPDARFFDFIVNKTKINKADMLMIGDSLSSDMKGGIVSGLDTCWICSDVSQKSDLPVTYRFRNLTEMAGELF